MSSLKDIIVTLILQNIIYSLGPIADLDELERLITEKIREIPVDSVAYIVVNYVSQSAPFTLKSI